MINLFSGTPGSGKSLHQSRVVEAWLKLNKPVIANYSIDTSKIKNCKGSFTEVNLYELNPRYLKEFSIEYFKNHKFKEGTIRLFIDEAQLLFNAREWSKEGRAEWLEFFTQHRKYGYDIYLIAQFDRMLDRQIRSLIEYEIIHRKISNFGLKGKIVSLFAGGGLFVAVKVWYPMKERVDCEFFRYSKHLASLYNSYQDFSQNAPEEKKTAKKNSSPKSEEGTAATVDDIIEFEELVKLFYAETKQNESYAN